MRTIGRSARRTPFAAGVVAAGLAAAALLLAACGSTAAGPVKGAAPAAATSAAAAVPAQDVVSAVQADPALKAELPAAVAARGTLILGTTQAPAWPDCRTTASDGSGKEIGLDIDLRNADRQEARRDLGRAVRHLPDHHPGRPERQVRRRLGQLRRHHGPGEGRRLRHLPHRRPGVPGLEGRQTGHVRQPDRPVRLTVATSPGSTFQQILTERGGQLRRRGQEAV